MGKNGPRYGTVRDVYAALKDAGDGISESMIRRHIKNAGIQKTPARKLYNIPKVLEAIRTAQLNDNKNQSSPGKSKKVGLECEILQIKIEELRGLSISVDDHLRELRQMQGLWNGVLDHFVSEASAITKDAHLVERLEHLVSGHRNMLCARIEAVEVVAE